VLAHDVDERAAFEVRTTEPFVEGVEDREQALLGSGGTALNFGLKPSLGPQFLSALEESQN
jgi:hypothetical protein